MFPSFANRPILYIYSYSSSSSSNCCTLNPYGGALYLVTLAPPLLPCAPPRPRAPPPPSPATAQLDLWSVTADTLVAARWERHSGNAVQNQVRTRSRRAVIGKGHEKDEEPRSILWHNPGLESVAADHPTWSPLLPTFFFPKSLFSGFTMWWLWLVLLL